jgi:hypothetical protein
LPPTIPPDATLNANVQGGSSTTGNLVGLYGGGILYNAPGLNYGTVMFPYAISFCSVPGQNQIRITGFGSVGPGLNSSEFLVTDWSSILTSSQGWPVEPACT